MPYIDITSLAITLNRLKGTADHLLKIWFTLKQMGMAEDNPVYVDTSNSTEALRRLFSFGDPEGKFYIPFAHTSRFMTAMHDASRSIIQTTLQRWTSSGSVVTVDPTDYLAIREMPDGMLEVKTGRNYPQGLGYGKHGFALADDTRVMIPLLSFGLWYYRQHDIPVGENITTTVSSRLRDDLRLSLAESEVIFVPDEPYWTPTFQDHPLSDNEIYEICQASIDAGPARRTTVIRESFGDYTIKVKSMVTITEGPQWLSIDPVKQFKNIVEAGSRAILLYGPPRTGKTRAVDLILSRDDSKRATIQIHNGWGYDELILGFRPDKEGKWDFVPGPLLNAIREGKSYIVLEEINRTEFSQAIGEVFSLLETPYRGEENSILLKNGELFYIPRETLIVCTMNTLDRTTEEIDDAFFGRMDAVDFPPRVEDLHLMLQDKGIDEEISRKIRELFSTINQYYPLGHGYFAPFSPSSNPITFYMSRIRPVLKKHLGNYRDQELASIDEKTNQLFG